MLAILVWIRLKTHSCCSVFKSFICYSVEAGKKVIFPRTSFFTSFWPSANAIKLFPLLTDKLERWLQSKIYGLSSGALCCSPPWRLVHSLRWKYQTRKQVTNSLSLYLEVKSTKGMFFMIEVKENGSKFWIPLIELIWQKCRCLDFYSNGFFPTVKNKTSFFLFHLQS